MNSKRLKIAFGAFGVLFLAFALSLTLVEIEAEPSFPRGPASVPEGYEAMKACQKQAVLWDKIKATRYSELPEFRKFGAFQLLAMARQEIGIKGSVQSDFTPPGWKKLIHGRGAIAGVKLVATGGKNTGVFKGADCALLRLSLTFKPTKARGVAPGLVLKVLRDGVPSGNISALVSLEGQEQDFNFFSHPLSNIVPAADGVGPKMMHWIFGRATKYPEELLAEDLAKIDIFGDVAASVSAPRQLFFVPGDGLTASSSEHDVREDFLKIPAGTTIYKIYAVSDNHKSFDYGKYAPELVPAFQKDSELIAELVTTTEFIASEFGDDGIFFRHDLRPK